MITRRFPPPRQAVLSSHELPPCTSFVPSQPSECPFGPRKDWHANRDELRSNRRRTRKPRKSERAKIESFILCPTFLVLRNVKQRRATVITPFLPTGFSRVSARKTGQPGPSQHDPTKPRHIKYSHEEGPGHISQGLTKFD